MSLVQVQSPELYDRDSRAGDKGPLSSSMRSQDQGFGRANDDAPIPRQLHAHAEGSHIDMQESIKRYNLDSACLCRSRDPVCRNEYTHLLIRPFLCLFCDCWAKNIQLPLVVGPPLRNASLQLLYSHRAATPMEDRTVEGRLRVSHHGNPVLADTQEDGE